MKTDIDFSISTSEAKVVCVVKETKSMALASHELDIPRTTLMSILGRLEKKLGSLIFHRKQGSGEVTITEYGESVIPKLEKLLGWVTVCEHELYSGVTGITKEKYHSLRPKLYLIHFSLNTFQNF